MYTLHNYNYTLCKQIGRKTITESNNDNKKTKHIISIITVASVKYHVIQVNPGSPSASAFFLRLFWKRNLR